MSIKPQYSVRALCGHCGRTKWVEGLSMPGNAIEVLQKIRETEEWTLGDTFRCKNCATDSLKRFTVIDDDVWPISKLPGGE